MVLTMKTQNLQQKNDMLLTVNLRCLFTRILNQFLINSSEANLCDYSGAYILVAGIFTVARGDTNTKVAFKNCAPLEKCRTDINDTFVDNILILPRYNLIEYSDNSSNTSDSLWQFKRDETEEYVDLNVDAQHIICHHLNINQVLLQAEMV